MNDDSVLLDNLLEHRVFNSDRRVPSLLRCQKW
jgi:hypothetical protein